MGNATLGLPLLGGFIVYVHAQLVGVLHTPYVCAHSTHRTLPYYTIASFPKYLELTQGPLLGMLERARINHGPASLAADHEALTQAHVSILAGACTGLALRCVLSLCADVRDSVETHVQTLESNVSLRASYPFML